MAVSTVQFHADGTVCRNADCQAAHLFPEAMVMLLQRDAKEMRAELVDADARRGERVRALAALPFKHRQVVELTGELDKAVQQLGDDYDAACREGVRLREEFEFAETVMSPEGRRAAQLTGELADGIREMRRQHQELLRHTKTMGDDRVAECKQRLDDVVNEVFTIADAYTLPGHDADLYTLGRYEGLNQARYAVLRGLGVFESNHNEYVPRPDYVYIAEGIFFGENVVDGRKRLGTCLTLEGALKAITDDEVFGEPGLVATPSEPSALHGEGGATWAVHPEGTEPDVEGCMWITREVIA